MGSDAYDDDSSGKYKRQDLKTRSGLLISALLAGICLGIMFAERLYIHFQEVEQSGVLPVGGDTSNGSGKAGRKLGQVQCQRTESFGELFEDCTLHGFVAV